MAKTQPSRSGGLIFDRGREIKKLQERIDELVAENKSARAKYDIYKGVAEQKVQQQAKRIKELEADVEDLNNELNNLIES